MPATYAVPPRDGLPAPRPPGPSPFAGLRLDAHNGAVDQATAARHQCGMRHLATGRVCRLPERHVGGCRFD